MLIPRIYLREKSGDTILIKLTQLTNEAEALLETGTFMGIELEIPCNNGSKVIKFGDETWVDASEFKRRVV